MGWSRVDWKRVFLFGKSRGESPWRLADASTQMKKPSPITGTAPRINIALGTWRLAVLAVDFAEEKAGESCYRVTTLTAQPNPTIRP